MIRRTMKGHEFVPRLAAKDPIIIVTDKLPDDKVLWEQATESDFGSSFRRMTVYAMNRRTLENSKHRVENYYGIDSLPTWVEPREEPGYAIAIPILGRDGLREWRIDFR